VISGSLQSMLQATVGNGLSLDPLSFCQDGRAPPEVDVGWREIVDAFVVTAVVVVVDERRPEAAAAAAVISPGKMVRSTSSAMGLLRAAHIKMQGQILDANWTLF